MINKKKAAESLKKKIEYGNNYNRQKYKKFAFMIDKETGEKLERIKIAKGVSYPELFRPFINSLIDSEQYLFTNIPTDTENNTNINN